MRNSLLLCAVGSTVIGAASLWRRHPRFGAAWVNRVVDPWLVRHGVIESTAGEIGLIEHVGRTSGIVRISPVHPVPTADGYRIIVPLGLESQWARNVLAAGRCRLQVEGTVHDLDDPVLVEPTAIDELPRLVGHAMTWLGFRYLLLNRSAETVGRLAA